MPWDKVNKHVLLKKPNVTIEVPSPPVTDVETTSTANTQPPGCKQVDLKYPNGTHYNRALIENLYYLAYNASEALTLSGFPWEKEIIETGSKSKGKKKKKRSSDMSTLANPRYAEPLKRYSQPAKRYSQPSTGLARRSPPRSAQPQTSPPSLRPQTPTPPMLSSLPSSSTKLPAALPFPRRQTTISATKLKKKKSKKTRSKDETEEEKGDVKKPKTESNPQNKRNKA